LFAEQIASVEYCYSMLKVMEDQLILIVIVLQSFYKVAEFGHIYFHVIEKPKSHQNTVHEVYLRLVTLQAKDIEVKTFKTTYQFGRPVFPNNLI